VRKADTDLQARFNAAIKAIRANGTYKKIQDKYFDFDVYGRSSQATHAARLRREPAARRTLTLSVAAASLGIALVLGLLGAMAKLSRLAPWRRLAQAYTTVIRAVPDLVLMLLCSTAARWRQRRVRAAGLGLHRHRPLRGRRG
jgi:ABC-type amino acid transport system permease subunit